MNCYLSSHSEITSFLGGTPLLYATLRVTGTCNLYCKHCYANAGKQVDTSCELTLDELKEVLYTLWSNGVRRLSISGGEPFCRTDIYEILKTASDLGFDIYISTNGVSNIDVEKLSRLRIKILQVSIDGLYETHDRVRGKSGSFSLATQFLQKMHYLKTTTIGVAFSLMRCNAHEVIPLFDYLLKNDLADIFSVIPVQKLGRANEEDVLSVTELHQELTNLADHYLQSTRNLELNIMVPPAIVPRQLADTQYRNGYVCEFPYSIAIDANGNCAMCDGLLNLPKYLEVSLRDNSDYCKNVHLSENSQSWLNTSPNTLSGVCALCYFKELCCGGCRIDAYINTQDVYASDPLCQKYFDNGLFPKEYLIK